ncbi:MAG: hypothetical protein IJO65_02030 [Lachnospiraceae bacterium]|nr:hypothetical protein [Lachnospiraceae bacterium]
MKSIVIRTIEDKLSAYGFTYINYNSCRWTFCREIDGISQNVVIQKDVWGGKTYRLELNSSVHQKILGLSDLSDDLRYCLDEIEYKDEKEQVAVLGEICDLVIKYGLDKSNNVVGVRRKHEVTSDMERKVFEENTLMTQNFLDRNRLCSLNRRDIFPIMKKELEEIYKKPYEQIVDKLLELAAVYGNMIIEVIGGSWNDRGIERQPFYKGYPVLKRLVTAWEEKKAEILVRTFVAIVQQYQKWVKNCLKQFGKIPQTMDKWSDRDVIRIMEEPLEEIEAYRQLERNLYEKHEDLIAEGKVLMEIEDMEDFHAIQVLAGKMRRLQERPIENIMHELLLLSALYGDIYKRIAKGEWLFDDRKGCIIRDGINFDLEPLRAIISAWMDSDYKGLVKTYQYGQIRVRMRTGHLTAFGDYYNRAEFSKEKFMEGK